MKRRKSSEVDALLQRLDTEGYVEVDVVDEYRDRAGTSRINLGVVRARSIVKSFLNRRPTMKMASRTFRDDNGAVLVVVRAEGSAEFFESYGQGFYDS